MRNFDTIHRMSYAVYTTRGFILGSSQSGEASKIYSLYTKDFGLIHAKAQGVRLLASKLRYNLEEYSFGSFSLVKGREIWRLTGVEQKSVPGKYAQIRARVLNLVRRLVQGEEKNDSLFNVLDFMMEGIGEREQMIDDMTAFESLILVHVLSSLGYIDSKSLLGIESGSAPRLADLEQVKIKKREVIFEINKALKETQL